MPFVEVLQSNVLPMLSVGTVKIGIFIFDPAGEIRSCKASEHCLVYFIVGSIVKLIFTTEKAWTAKSRSLKDHLCCVVGEIPRNRRISVTLSKHFMEALGIVVLLGEQGWRSGQSTRLPPMWPGFDSRTRRHMWVEFVGSLQEVFLRVLRFFPLSPKTNISKFQFDPDAGPP